MAADDDLHSSTGHAGDAGTGQELEPAGSHAVESHTEHESPEDWGWRHEFTTGRQVGGWVTFAILAVLLTTTHYNRAGSLAILLMMVALAGGLLWDRQRRRTQWRS